MALVWTRVDQKLIHGQISVAWIPHLSADAVVVVDKDVAADGWAQKVMTLGLPPEIRLTGFVPPTDLERLLDEAAYRAGRVLVIFKDIGGVEEAMAAGFRTEILNLGNQACQSPEGEVRLAECFYVRPNELDLLAGLQRRGLRVLLQVLPSSKAIQWRPDDK